MRPASGSKIDTTGRKPEPQGVIGSYDPEHVVHRWESALGADRRYLRALSVFSDCSSEVATWAANRLGGQQWRIT